MKKVILSVFILTVLASGCNHLDNTPEAVIDEYIKAVADFNYDKLREMSYGNAQRNVDVFEEMSSGRQSEFNSTVDYEIDFMVEDGDKLVYVLIVEREDGQIESDQITLTKIDGKYRIVE